MPKPTLFFIHATEDQAYLETLKRLLLKKTDETVDIFLSSDGQSIPFGTNWVHEVENALEKADIAFVFLSPHSLSSQWVFFEAGYTYSKGIKVIPIGILGMDLSEIRPPLKLLQGFNLSSREHLENIIAFINDKFNFSHKELFSHEDYQRLQEAATGGNRHGKLSSIVDRIYIALGSHITEDIEPIPSVWSNLKTYLREQNIEHNSPYNKEGEEVILTHGAKFRKVKSKKDQEEKYYIIIEFDLFLLNRNLGKVKKILELAFNGGRERYHLLIFFKDKVDILTEEHAITSRIYNTDLSLSTKRPYEYQYKNFRFTIEKRGELKGAQVALKVGYKIKDLEDLPLFELLNLLIKAKIIRVS